jgi:CRP-like cAMP-binding protein
MATKRAKNTNVSGKPAKLAETPKFDAKAFLSSVGSGRSTEKYERKKIIFRQGDPADGVFYIQSGKIELSVVSQQGKERVIALLSAGDFFGEGCLAGQPLHMASAIALAESTIFRIEKQTMIRVLRDEPTLSEMFMGFLLSRNIQFEADLVDQLFNSSERRLALLPPPACQLRQGGRTRVGHSPDQPRSLGDKGGDDSLPHQLLHEQIPKAWPDRVQRPPEGPQRAFECRRPRLRTVLGRTWIHSHLRGGIGQALVRMRHINFDPQITTP